MIPNSLKNSQLANENVTEAGSEPGTGVRLSILDNLQLSARPASSMFRSRSYDRQSARLKNSRSQRLDPNTYSTGWVATPARTMFKSIYTRQLCILVGFDGTSVLAVFPDALCRSCAGCIPARWFRQSIIACSRAITFGLGVFDQRWIWFDVIIVIEHRKPARFFLKPWNFWNASTDNVLNETHPSTSLWTSGRSSRSW
jgi:hypothetical protein